MENFIRNVLIFFLKINCGYTLEPPRRGGFNENPQSMFWSKNKKNRYTPEYSPFYYIKVGFKGVYIARTCFPNVENDNQTESLKKSNGLRFYYL